MLTLNGPVLDKNMQTLPPTLKKNRFDLLIQIVEKRSETNENLNKKNSDFFFNYDRFIQFSSV